MKTISSLSFVALTFIFVSCGSSTNSNTVEDFTASAVDSSIIAIDSVAALVDSAAAALDSVVVE